MLKCLAEHWWAAIAATATPLQGLQKLLHILPLHDALANGAVAVTEIQMKAFQLRACRDALAKGGCN